MRAVLTVELIATPEQRESERQEAASDNATGHRGDQHGLSADRSAHDRQLVGIAILDTDQIRPDSFDGRLADNTLIRNRGTEALFHLSALAQSPQPSTASMTAPALKTAVAGTPTHSPRDSQLSRVMDATTVSPPGRVMDTSVFTAPGISRDTVPLR